MIIPLASSGLPGGAVQLREAIEQGLTGLSLAPRSVTVEAPAWPAVQSLEIDLSGASIADVSTLPRLAESQRETLSVAMLRVAAQPVTVQGISAGFETRAHGATLQLTSLTGGRSALVIQSAQSGSVELRAGLRDLERGAQTLLSAQARQHGADIAGVRLQVHPRGPRALSFEAEVIAKIMMMKAPVTVAGDAELGEDLQLRLSGLKVAGSGMAAGLARGFLQPHFDRFQKTPLALGRYALGGLRLKDAAITLEGETLILRAQFGT